MQLYPLINQAANQPSRPVYLASVDSIGYSPSSGSIFCASDFDTTRIAGMREVHDARKVQSMIVKCSSQRSYTQVIPRLVLGFILIAGNLHPQAAAQLLSDRPLQTSQAGISTSQGNSTAQQQLEIQGLIGWLRYGHVGQRVAAARRLAEFGTSANSASAALLASLSDPSVDLRVTSAYALTRVSLDRPTTIRALLPLLGDASEHVRYSAQWSIARLVPDLPLDMDSVQRQQMVVLLQEVLREFSHFEHQSRHRSIIESSLIALREQTASAPLAGHGSNSVAATPVTTTTTIITPSVSVMQTSEVSSEELIRGFYQPADFVSRLQIIERLRDGQLNAAKMRQKILLLEASLMDASLLEFAVARWGQPAQQDLAEILTEWDRAGEFPEAAARLLESVRPQESTTVRLLQGWSRNTHQPLDVRASALRALARTEHEIQACAQWLADSLTDRELGSYAADSLSLMGTQAASVEPMLISALMQSQDELLLTTGLDALLAISPDSQRAAQFVVEKLSTVAQQDSHDSFLVYALLDACRRYGELAKTAAPSITAQLQNPDPMVRKACVEALGSMLTEIGQSLPKLQYMLIDPAEEISVKNAIAHLLGRLDPEAVQPVIDSLRNHIDRHTRVAPSGIAPSFQASNDQVDTDEIALQLDLLRALAVIGPAAIAGKEICVELVLDRARDLRLRVAAAHALGAMASTMKFGDSNGTANEARSDLPPNLPSAQPDLQPAMLAELLLQRCTTDEAIELQAACLLAAARLHPHAARELAEINLSSPASVLRASAAVAMHGCGESRLAFDTLLDMVRNHESDQVIREVLAEMGDSIADWLVEQAENTERSQAQRLMCCDLACLVSSPNWLRLLKLVEDPMLGQQFAGHLSYHWHPEIAFRIESHSAEVDQLVHLIQSPETTAEGRVRLANLLQPDGLGAGADDGQWSGIALSRMSSTELLQKLDLGDSQAVGQAIIVPEPPAEALSSDREMSENFEAARSTAEMFPAIPPVDPAALQPWAAEQTSPTVTPLTQDGLKRVEVFYGTNRQKERAGNSIQQIVTAILVATLGSVIILGLSGVGSFSRGWRFMGLLCVLGMFVFGAMGVWAAQRLSLYPVQSLVSYNHLVSESVTYGKCVVTLPPNHQPGMVEAPILLKGQFIADPNKHVMLEKVEELSPDAFLADIKAMQAAKGKNLLVFIHGYNVSFDDAAKRTAQMSFDLDFPGAAIFYSWPSQANWYGYKSDKQRIEQSVQQIRGFLENLAQKSGADTINLVAHSMGNVGLTAALREISSDTGQPIFNQVVLAAPDIDAEVFRNEIAPAIVTKARRLTLYTSKTDLALIASRYFNQAPRLGDSGPEIVTFPGIDTIDASTIDSSLLGHSYYGSNVTVLTDIGRLLRGEPINHRSYLRQFQQGATSYWTFDPVLISRAIDSPTTTQ